MKRCQHDFSFPIRFGTPGWPAVELYKPRAPGEMGEVRFYVCADCGALRITIWTPATQLHPETTRTMIYLRDEPNTV